MMTQAIIVMLLARMLVAVEVLTPTVAMRAVAMAVPFIMEAMLAELRAATMGTVQGINHTRLEATIV